MDAQAVREMALSIVREVNFAPDQVKGQWASWNLAEQVNKLIEAAAAFLPNERRQLLPNKFEQSALGVAAARYLDLAIAASQVAELLRGKEQLQEETA